MPESDAGMSPELIDFSLGGSSPRLTPLNRLSESGIHIVRGRLTPNEDGQYVGASQFSIAFNAGEPFEFEYRLPGSDRLRRSRVETGMAHINPGDTPFFQRWSCAPGLLVIAFEKEAIDRIGHDAFGLREIIMETRIAIDDPELRAGVPVWQRELNEGGPRGRLFVESLAKATAIHLLCHYGRGDARPPPIAGGMGGWRLNRITEYIEANLDQNLSIRELATVVDLSPAHFATSFRNTTGVPPHRYVVARRIERAKQLLLQSRMSVTHIAYAVGFASHGHFTSNFHKATGMTPSRYRMERK